MNKKSIVSNLLVFLLLNSCGNLTRPVSIESWGESTLSGENLPQPSSKNNKLNQYNKKGQLNAGPVNFYYFPALGEAIEDIFIPGNWNQWQPDDPTVKMLKQADGSYKITIPLSSGRYHYKYIINGDWTASFKISGRIFPTPHYIERGCWEDGNAVVIVSDSK